MTKKISEAEFLSMIADIEKQVEEGKKMASMMTDAEKNEAYARYIKSCKEDDNGRK